MSVMDKKRLIGLIVLIVVVISILASINYEKIKEMKLFVKDREKIKTEPRPTPEDAADRLNITSESEVKSYMGQRLTPIDEQRKWDKIEVSKKEYILQVYGLVNEPRNLSYEYLRQDIPKLSSAVVINFVDGDWYTAKWTGVPFFELLMNAKGEQEGAEYVNFHSADGSVVQLSLNYLIGEEIILAYKNNDITLTAEQGFPLILAAEEKWEYKWQKWIVGIEFTDMKIEGEDKGNWGDIQIKPK